MILFFLKSMLCTAFLFMIYKLFLERNKMHQFNRFFLLGILMISIGVPNLNVFFAPNNIIHENMYSEAVQNVWDTYFSYVFSVYCIVAVLLLMRLLYGLRTLMKKVKQSEHRSYQNIDVVLVKDEVLPHSFLKYVFVNENDYKKGIIQKELFTHEITHVKEHHSLDILFVELFYIVFWFNPLVYFVKKSIRLNHEFIADQSVLDVHNDTIKYQKLLIGLSTTGQPMLTSQINYGLMKKRFVMMTSKSTKQRSYLVKLGLIPILIITVFLFSNSSSIEEHTLDGEHTEHEQHDLVEQHH